MSDAAQRANERIQRIISNVRVDSSHMPTESVLEILHEEYAPLEAVRDAAVKRPWANFPLELQGWCFCCKSSVPTVGYQHDANCPFADLDAALDAADAGGE